MFRLRIFILILLVSLIYPWPRVQAQEILAGGSGSNLVVREGNVTIQSETLEIKLHLGFAEVEQDFVIQNSETPQKVTFGFPYRLGNNEQSLNNFRVIIDDSIVKPDSTKESDGEVFIYWKIFNVEFGPNQTKQIKISHWQMNGANLRGLRTFNYSLKNKLSTEIGEFNLHLFLMDGLNLDSFNRTLNPDLDLRLEPLGWEKQGAGLVWQWQNFEPGFNIMANFYWPAGDLAKTADLDQNFGLYQVKATSGDEEASQVADSSYLSAWQEKASGPGVGESLSFAFDQTRTIQELRIIPGHALSLDNFQNYSRPQELKLNFSDGTSQTAVLADEMKMQYITLSRPVKTDRVEMILNSIYAGKFMPDDTFITEVEFGSNLTQLNLDYNGQIQNNAKPAWQMFFINLWDKIANWWSQLLSIF